MKQYGKVHFDMIPVPVPVPLKTTQLSEQALSGERQQAVCAQWLNPSNAKATFTQSTIETLSCRCSLDSSRGALSDEYPCARVAVIFHVFFTSFCIDQIIHQ